MQRLYFILVYLYSFVALNAQTPYFHFNEYTPVDIKLNTGIVKGYQDHLGYLWLCGFDGISRYNGIEFESIETLYPGTSAIPIKHFRSMYIDQDYTLWLCSYGSGLYRITSSGEVTDFDTLTVEGQNLPTKVVSDVIVSNNQVWVLGKFGLRAYEFENGYYRLLPMDSFPNPEKITAISLSDDNSIWLSDRKRVYRYGVGNKEVKTFGDFNNSKVNQDYFGNIWILKREDGNYLYKYSPNEDSFILNDKQPFSSIKRSLTLAWDYQNRIWASQFDTQFHMGDMNTGELVVTSGIQHNLKFSQFVRKPLVDKSGGVWIFNGSAYMLPFSNGFNPIHFDVTNDKTMLY